jgi:membrane-associated phospholipid phosphatase
VAIRRAPPWRLPSCSVHVVADPVDDRADRGTDHLGPWVASFDRRIDLAFDRIRGEPAVDRVFLAASRLGDWSLVWHLLGIIRSVARRRPDQAIALALALGVESLVVNQGIKRIFRRQRPTVAGADGLDVRAPSTSSFPSGHASSAAFASTILIRWDGRRWAPLWLAVAALVGLSRVHVRIHHASDIVAGAVVGNLLARACRRVLR